jgi:hypothetical protein
VIRIVGPIVHAKWSVFYGFIPLERTEEESPKSALRLAYSYKNYGIQFIQARSAFRGCGWSLTATLLRNAEEVVELDSMNETTVVLGVLLLPE